MEGTKGLGRRGMAAVVMTNNGRASSGLFLKCSERRRRRASPWCSRERERMWRSASVRESSEQEGSLWMDGEGPRRAAVAATSIG
jgi:hypothetical protein